MLGKLIKNEFKATSRNYIPIYILMLVVTVFMKVLMEIQDGAEGTFSNSRLIDLLTILSVTTFVIAIMAVIFGTIVLIIKRFYDNMLKDEGYLSFTLPVTTGQHIIGKVFTSYVWVLCSGVVIIASILILFIGDGEAFAEVGKVITEIFRAVDAYGLWGVVIEIIVLIILSIYANIMMWYTCLSVGQNFNKHRVAGAFITYIAIYMITQILNIIFLSVLLGINYENEMLTVESGLFQPYMIYILGLTIVQTVVFTGITYFMLERKLNLE